MNVRFTSGLGILALVLVSVGPAGAQRRLTRLSQASSPIVVEGEDLVATARVSGGRVDRQPMSRFGRSWSANSQLFWMASGPGARLELIVPVLNAGTYALAGYFTKAPDYGAFQVGAHGRQTGEFNGYNARGVVHSGQIALGNVSLQAGNNQIIFVVTGKHPRSTGYLVGIDRLELTLLKPTRDETKVKSQEHRLRQSVESFDQYLSSLSTGGSWQRYLQIEELKRLMAIPRERLDATSRAKLKAIMSKFETVKGNPTYGGITTHRVFQDVVAAMDRRISLSSGVGKVGGSSTVKAVLPIKNRQFIAIRQYPAKLKPIKINQISLPYADLRPTIRNKNIPIRNQGSRGTCSVFAITFLHEYMYATKKNLNYHDLSEEYLNYVTNLEADNDVDGDFFLNVDIGYQRWGAYPEGLVPYQSAYDPDFKVPQAYMDIAQKWEKFSADFIKPWDNTTGATPSQLDRAISYLDQHTPVAAGFWWPSSASFQTKDFNGVDLMTTPAKKDVFDGHSVVLVGYGKHNSFPGGGYFVYRNSWGNEWGDAGYGYMPFEYVLKYANDLLAYR